MLEVNIPSDRGNAPKKKLLADFNIAFAKGQVDEITSHFTVDITWERVGDKTVRGISKVKALLEKLADYNAEELHIHQIITHGKEASARGELVFKNERIVFADFYEFSSAGSKKIRRMISYAIPSEAGLNS